MNDTPTPETDALEQKQSSEGCPQWNDMMRWVREHASLARKLERERDEAQESLKHIAEYGTEEINAAVELRQKLASALVERDEWAAMCGRYKQERDIAEQDATNYHARIFELIDEKDKTKQELNEVRQQIDQYRDKLDLTPTNWDI